jgi:hypothetical protein
VEVGSRSISAKRSECSTGRCVSGPTSATARSGLITYRDPVAVTGSTAPRPAACWPASAASIPTSAVQAGARPTAAHRPGRGLARDNDRLGDRVVLRKRPLQRVQVRQTLPILSKSPPQDRKPCRPRPVLIRRGDSCPAEVPVVTCGDDNAGLALFDVLLSATKIEAYLGWRPVYDPRRGHPDRWRSGWPTGRSAIEAVASSRPSFPGCTLDEPCDSSATGS